MKLYAILENFGRFYWIFRDIVFFRRPRYKIVFLSAFLAFFSCKLSLVSFADLKSSSNEPDSLENGKINKVLCVVWKLFWWKSCNAEGQKFDYLLKNVSTVCLFYQRSQLWLASVCLSAASSVTLIRNIHQLIFVELLEKHVFQVKLFQEWNQALSRAIEDLKSKNKRKEGLNNHWVWPSIFDNRNCFSPLSGDHYVSQFNQDLKTFPIPLFTDSANVWAEFDGLRRNQICLKLILFTKFSNFKSHLCLFTCGRIQGTWPRFCEF